MKEIPASTVTLEVARLCQETNFNLDEATRQALEHARGSETSPLGRETLDILLENARLAQQEKLPVCQDCGTAVLFVEIGQEVHLTGDSLNEAITEGGAAGIRTGLSAQINRQLPLFQPPEHRRQHPPHHPLRNRTGRPVQD